MKNSKSKIASLISALLISGFAPSIATAQWVVIDPAVLGKAIMQEINQLEQIAISSGMNLQQLKDYRLQLQNLQMMEKTLRNDVKNQLKLQLLNNIRDYGRSNLNRTSTLDPNSNSYYVNAESVVKTSIGNVPRTTAATDADLSNLGMATGQNTAIGMSSYRDRQQYDRVMDDMRQVALTRSNAESRSTQANAINTKMASLEDNNTVGAIQLLAAQNALTYAQNEDSIKTQAALLKNTQEEQLRALADREATRKRELDRLAKARAERAAPVVNMTP